MTSALPFGPTLYPKDMARLHFAFVLQLLVLMLPRCARFPSTRSDFS